MLFGAKLNRFIAAYLGIIIFTIIHIICATLLASAGLVERTIIVIGNCRPIF